MTIKSINEKDSCPSCGNKFHCSRSKACWCYEFSLTSEQLDYLELHYDQCLCPTCMKDLSQMKGKFENID